MCAIILNRLWKAEFIISTVFLTLIPTISSTAITNAVLLFNLMKFYY